MSIKVNSNIGFFNFRDNKSTLKTYILLCTYVKIRNPKKKNKKKIITSNSYTIWLWILCLSHNEVNNPSHINETNEHTEKRNQRTRTNEKTTTNERNETSHIFGVFSFSWIKNYVANEQHKQTHISIKTEKNHVSTNSPPKPAFEDIFNMCQSQQIETGCRQKKSNFVHCFHCSLLSSKREFNFKRISFAWMDLFFFYQKN